MVDPRTDSQLVDDLNAGDASAFDAIYYRYRDRVMRLAFRFTSNEADALDVLQEAFTYLYKKFPGFRLTAAMTTFLFPVVRNLSLEIRRKRFPSPGTPGEGRGEGDLGAAVTFDSPSIEQSRTDLAAAMASLSPEHREVVLLRFVDDLSIDEIAAAVAIPEGTVKSRLHHALAALRNDPRIKNYFS
jgi:RNA polymerase sigma-70 factor, ECF subfamily